MVKDKGDTIAVVCSEVCLKDTRMHNYICKKSEWKGGSRREELQYILTVNLP